MLKLAAILIAGVMSITFLTGCADTEQTIIESDNNPQSTSVSVEEDIDEAEENNTVVGAYTGQIDNNSIEINISGLADEDAYRAFALSEEVKVTFRKMEINPNEIVKISYEEREGQQPLILKIERTPE